MKTAFAYVTFAVIMVVLPFPIKSQEKTALSFLVQVTDEGTDEALTFAHVQLAGSKTYNNVTGEDGTLLFSGIPSGDYELIISYIGYHTWRKPLTLATDTLLTVKMQTNFTSLNEVVVTATESKGLSSSSVIDRKAMEHLQPSSFTDILELLPGHLSAKPALTGANFISLRRSGISDTENNYGTGSLGTAFIIDGIPLSADASMHSLSAAGDVQISGDGAGKYRLTTNKGVDMRSIPTDGIERVQVIRGIPSARYGDLTDGLVLIERKQGDTPLNMRFKSDGYSKLFAVDKGIHFSQKNIGLNIGLDYLDAKSSPVNTMENYKRLTASVRINKTWSRNHLQLRWNPVFDAYHTLDKDETDPDADYTHTDSYRSSNNRISFGQTFSIDFTGKQLFRSVEASAGIAYENDRINQVKFVQISTPTAISNRTEEGPGDGIYLPSNWVSQMQMDGRPISMHAKVTTLLHFNTSPALHKVTAGTEWNFDKNYGKGMVYDPQRPPSTETTARPRPYSDIPASNQLAFFVEDVIEFPVALNHVKISGGLRISSMKGLGSAYLMSGKVYPEPRFCVQWIFPSFILLGQEFLIDLTAGYGLNNKFPTLAQLYPDYTYIDAVQLNYYHSNPDYRRIYLMTFKRKHVNYSLSPAKNHKLDLRLNLGAGRNNLSVNWFHERMTTAFRTQTAALEPLVFKNYIVPAGYPETHQGRPNPDDLAFTHDTILYAFSYTGNGSVIDKRGVEFTLQTKRWTTLKTRLTIDGAWLKTEYGNSAPYYYKPYQQINNWRIEKYGVYREESGYIREEFNTRIMLDTYLPELDMEFSTTLECQWFHISQNKPRSEVPQTYVDTDGTIQPYTDADKDDPILQWFYTPHNPNSFRKERIPLGLSANLKASKNILNKARISLFVKGLIDYFPPYEINGTEIRRDTDPYFGMEFTFTL